MLWCSGWAGSGGHQCGCNLVGAKAIFIGLVLIGLPFIPNAQRVSVFIG